MRNKVIRENGGMNMIKKLLYPIISTFFMILLIACTSEESKNTNEKFKGSMEIVDSSGNLLFTTNDLQSVDTSEINQDNYAIDMFLKDNAAERLEEVTESKQGDVLNVYVDKELLISYTISKRITDGHIKIEGCDTLLEAYGIEVAIKNGIENKGQQNTEPPTPSQPEIIAPDEKQEEEITLVKIEAEYLGGDEAGVVLGSDLGDIDVTCIYSDGSTEEIYDGFSVKKTATLKPNKISTITVTYEGKECKLKVKCSTKKKHRKGKDIVGISNKDIYDIDDSFQANEVRNDVTGNWRISTIATSIKMPQYALSYYKAKFRNDKEIHGIVNFNYKTTTKISVMGNMLDVTVHEYVKGEEHDANLLFSGMLLKEYNVYLDNGDIKKIQ